MKKIPILKRTCCSTLKTMYHEKKHHMQQETNSNSFDSIIFQIETLLKLHSTIEYSLQHDNWYLETDANNYGVKKTLEYYQAHTNDDNVDWDYLKRLEKLYEYDELTYNFDDFFTNYNIYRKKGLLLPNKKKKHLYGKKYYTKIKKIYKALIKF